MTRVFVVLDWSVVENILFATLVKISGHNRNILGAYICHVQIIPSLATFVL
jgi:hypothetical protein